LIFIYHENSSLIDFLGSRNDSFMCSAFSYQKFKPMTIDFLVSNDLVTSLIETFEKCSILFKVKSKIPDFERGKARFSKGSD